MRIIASLTAIFMTSANAYAADAIIYNEPAPIVVDTFSWTGGYIGVNAGYAWGKAKNRSNDYDYDYEEQYTDISTLLLDDTFRLSKLDDSHSISGFNGGVQAGYNWQYDRTVFGLETDIQASGIKGNLLINSVALGLNEVKSFNTKVDWFGTTRARIGYLPSERLMVYATGGIAYGRIKVDYSYDLEALVSLPGQPADIHRGNSISKNKFGYTVGAGTEYALTDNWTVKTEYLYTNLGKINYNAPAMNYDGGINDVEHSTKVDFHTIRVGVNYKF